MDTLRYDEVVKKFLLNFIKDDMNDYCREYEGQSRWDAM